jgi:ATP-dependent DNA ligase
MRTHQSQGRGTNRADCMRQFKAAWRPVCRRPGQPDRVHGRKATRLELAFPRPNAYVRLTRSAFLRPCLPTSAKVVPATPDWLREVKYDGYRLIVARDGDLAAKVAGTPKTKPYSDLM